MPGEFVTSVTFEQKGYTTGSATMSQAELPLDDVGPSTHASHGTRAPARERVPNEIHVIENEEKRPHKEDMIQFMKRFHVHDKKGDDGRPSDAWGLLHFANTERRAPYLRLSVKDTPANALLFVKGMLAQKYGENYDRPSLLLSVTGGARNFTLPQRLENAISKGLRQAAQRTNAWVITGGTNTGVMKLTGEIMEKLSKTQTGFVPPTIGIATYGVIVGGQDLTAKDGRLPVLDAKHDINKKDPPKAPLNPDHNLFLLVDDGSNKQFGREITFRAAFEKVAGEAFEAPVVTIVVQGGPGTLNTALQAVKQGTPIVVVDGSGLAADVLAYAYNFLHNPLSRFTAYTIEDLRQKVDNTFGNPSPEKLEELLQSALDCVQDPNLVVVYSLQDSGIDEFDDCILEAIFNSHGSLSNKLKQAMYFDRIDKARKKLSDATEEDLNECINENLMAALTHNKPHFVELYLNHGAKIYMLRPLNTKAPFAYPAKPAFVYAVSELYENEGKRLNSYVRALAGKSSDKGHAPGRTRSQAQPYANGDNMTSTDGQGVDYSVENMERVLSHLVSAKFKVSRPWDEYPAKAYGPSPTGRDGQGNEGAFVSDTASATTQETMLQETSVDAPQAPVRRAASSSSIAPAPAPKKRPQTVTEEGERRCEAQAAHILFLWAVCLDKFRMAKMFWQRGEQSIINALVASRILERLSTHRALSGPHLADERAKMKKTSKKFERLAVGVLEECHNSDSYITAEMLHFKNEKFANKNAISIASDADSLAFLSHPATQSVVNADWYGQLESVTSFRMVLFAFFMPFFVLPFIKFQQEKAGGNQQLAGCDFFDKGEEEDRMQIMTDTSLKRKFAKFYSAPYTRFISDLLSHLALCILSSYFVLDNLSDDTVEPIEWVLFIWFLALLLEELRQMIFQETFVEYINDQWNRLDLIMIALFFAGFFVRIADVGDHSNQYASRAVHAFLVVVLWMRLMRYYALSQNLGPKLIMMAEMIKDVTTFVCLLVIFLVGYGVAAQSLLFPDQPFSRQTVVNVLFHPYFQIYGELFLEDLDADSGCTGIYPFSDCGREEVRLLPFFLAVYVLVTNILLVNLLIAMFNDTYIKVQEKAADLWRKQNYELFAEYKDRPFLPAPLILLTHLYLLFTFCCRRRRPDDDGKGGSKEKDKMARITRFEEFNTEEYLKQSAEQESKMLESRVRHTNENVGHALRRLDELMEHMQAFRSTLDRQAITLKQEIRADTGLHGHDKAAQKGMRRNQSSSSVAVTGRVDDGNYVPPVEYPGSGGVKRQALHPSMVPWSSDCPNYNPTKYTAPSVAKQPVWADPADPRAIKFNTKDEVNGKVVDRTTCHPLGIIRIEEEKGRPINPFGRTGMTGRGLLGKWGVNQAADTVVTRWRRSRDGNILERDGKKVLEFVAIQRMDNEMWAIPGGFVDNGEDRATASGREFMEETLGIKEGKELSNEEEDSLRALFSGGEAIDRIYSEDPRNTDNAWIETTCVNFHDDTGRYASKLKLKGGDDAKHAQWMMVHGGLKLFASHKKLLRIITDHHSAYF